MAVRCFDMFEHYHRIGAWRDRGAGHDLPCGPWRQLDRRRLACPGAAGDGERDMRGSFFSAAGKAIARGTGEGRLIAVRAQRARKDPAWRPAEFHALDRGAELTQLGGICGDQRSGFVVTGQSGTHAMDCRGLKQVRRILRAEIQTARKR